MSVRKDRVPKELKCRKCKKSTWQCLCVYEIMTPEIKKEWEEAQKKYHEVNDLYTKELLKFKRKYHR